ncbi:glycosyltransferase [Patescibacteria group bacterium]|nr:glycosyltransferase [Patescibacteria group bacterium]
MKLAIVYDDLIQHGGAEKVLEALSDIFPDAPIYTSVASKEWLDKFKNKNRTVITSFLQKFPLAVKLNRYYSPFLLHVLAFESFDLADYDLVLSYSSRFSHFVITKPGTKHICYMNSPGRMFWEPFDYFENESYGFLRPFKLLARKFLKLPLSYIRMVDFNASKKVDCFFANSRTSQKRIKKYYGRDAEIIYPFVETNKFKNVESEDGDYFLVITRLSAWKKVDIAINACENIQEKLKIIGEGPDMTRLKNISKYSTDFLGYVSEDEKKEVIRKCKAVIITQKEDFGIVPLEAMACGKPVIAFGEGGVVETVLPGKTGEFFDIQNSSSLEKVIKNFDLKKFSVEDCKSRAKEFDIDIFEKKIRELIIV